MPAPHHGPRGPAHLSSLILSDSPSPTTPQPHWLPSFPLGLQHPRSPRPGDCTASAPPAQDCTALCPTARPGSRHQNELLPEGKIVPSQDWTPALWSSIRPPPHFSDEETEFHIGAGVVQQLKRVYSRTSPEALCLDSEGSASLSSPGCLVKDHGKGSPRSREEPCLQFVQHLGDRIPA